MCRLQEHRVSATATLHWVSEGAHNVPHERPTASFTAVFIVRKFVEDQTRNLQTITLWAATGCGRIFVAVTASRAPVLSIVAVVLDSSGFVDQRRFAVAQLFIDSYQQNNNNNISDGMIPWKFRFH